jgi:hypothetical protein
MKDKGTLLTSSSQAANDDAQATPPGGEPKEAYRCVTVAPPMSPQMTKPATLVGSFALSIS